MTGLGREEEKPKSALTMEGSSGFYTSGPSRHAAGAVFVQSPPRTVHDDGEPSGVDLPCCQVGDPYSVRRAPESSLITVAARVHRSFYSHVGAKCGIRRRTRRLDARGSHATVGVLRDWTRPTALAHWLPTQTNRGCGVRCLESAMGSRLPPHPTPHAFLCAWSIRRVAWRLQRLDRPKRSWSCHWLGSEATGCELEASSPTLFQGHLRAFANCDQYQIDNDLGLSSLVRSTGWTNPGRKPEKRRTNNPGSHGPLGVIDRVLDERYGIPGWEPKRVRDAGTTPGSGGEGDMPLAALALV